MALPLQGGCSASGRLGRDPRSPARRQGTGTGALAHTLVPGRISWWRSDSRPFRGVGKIDGRTVFKVCIIPNEFHSASQFVQLLVLLGGQGGVGCTGWCKPEQGWSSTEVFEVLKAGQYPTGVRVVLEVPLHEEMRFVVVVPVDANALQGFGHCRAKLLSCVVDVIMGRTCV